MFLFRIYDFLNQNTSKYEVYHANKSREKNDLVNNLYEPSNQNSVINCLSSFLFKYEEKKSNQGKEDDT